MGETLTNSAVFYADLLDHYQDLLGQHYHRLTRVIRPHLFYGWLRAKGVYTQADQEEVENRYVTTCMKAGCLIDIIGTKGQAGFIAFLEVVEYEYGDLFLEITEKQPRMPPREFTPIPPISRGNDSKRQVGSRRGVLNSVNLLEMIGELAYSLTKQIASKSDELNRLNNLVDDVQTERENVAEENARMYAELKEARETVEELKQEKVEQLKRHRQMKDERDRLQTECCQLREQKDSFMDQCHRLREKIVNLGHSPSIRRNQPSEEAKAELKFQKKTEFISVKEKTSCRSVVETSDADQLLLHAKDEIKRLKAVLKDYQTKEQQWHDEKEQLEETAANLQCYQENSAQWQLSIDQIKNERDKALKECEELTKKHSDTIAKNEQLSSECRRYMEQFKRMEEMIGKLKCEIDERNRQSDRLQNRAKVLQNRGDDVETPSVVLRDPPVKSSTLDGGHSPLKRATPLAPFVDVKDKRKASYMTAFPLSIFAPDSVQQQLFDFLLQYFDNCQSDDDVRCRRTDSADNAPEHEVICEWKTRDGSTYHVTIEQLKKCLAKSKTAVLIPSIKVAAISSMHQQDIEPLIVVVKFKNEFDCTELSAVEESLDHYGRGHYETVVVSESLASDFTRFSQHILREVYHLVDKYTFLIGLGCGHHMST